MPVTLEGFPELIAQLDKLSFIGQREIMTRAITAGAEPVRAGAASMAPVRSGVLSQNIIVKVTGREQSANQVIAKIGPSKTAWYGRFVELGTINMRATPFLDPAIIQNMDRATEAAAEVIREEIDKLTG